MRSESIDKKLLEDRTARLSSCREDWVQCPSDEQADGGVETGEHLSRRVSLCYSYETDKEIRNSISTTISSSYRKNLKREGKVVNTNDSPIETAEKGTKKNKPDR